MGARARQGYFSGRIVPKDVASATTVALPSHFGGIKVSGTTAIANFATDKTRHGRTLRIEAAGSFLLTTADASTTKDTIDVGAADVAMTAGDVLDLRQVGNGVWVRTDATST